MRQEKGGGSQSLGAPRGRISTTVAPVLLICVSITPSSEMASLFPLFRLVLRDAGTQVSRFIQVQSVFSKSETDLSVLSKIRIPNQTPRLTLATSEETAFNELTKLPHLRRVNCESMQLSMGAVRWRLMTSS